MTVEELLEKAKDQRQRGRLDEALISARHATRLEPKNADAFWQVALCELDVDAAGEAVESLEKVTALAPQFAHGWSKLGLAHQKTGNNDRAKECFERATELSPDQVEALIALTPIYERDKQPDDEM